LGVFSWFHLFYVVNISLYHDFPTLIGSRRLSSLYLFFQIDQTLYVLVVRLWSIFEDSQFGWTRYYWKLTSTLSRVSCPNSDKLFTQFYFS
jgi:hypothetical protein